jgi:hypothetical protein
MGSDAVHCANLPRVITELDQRTLLDFIQAAAESETWALRDSIYNHLASKAAISATTKVRMYGKTFGKMLI